MLKVKVPIIFLGTVGFSPHREGRYYLREVLGLLQIYIGMLVTFP